MPPPPPRKPLGKSDSFRSQENLNPFQVPLRRHSLAKDSLGPRDDVTENEVRPEFSTPVKADDSVRQKSAMTRPTGSPVTPFPTKKNVSFCKNASYGMSALLNSGIYDEPLEKLGKELDGLDIKRRTDSIGGCNAGDKADENSELSSSPVSPTQNHQTQVIMGKGRSSRIRGNAANVGLSLGYEDSTPASKRQEIEELEKLYKLQQKQMLVLENSVQALSKKLLRVKEELHESRLDALTASMGGNEREKMLIDEVDRLRKANKQLVQELDVSNKAQQQKLVEANVLVDTLSGQAWDLQLMTGLLKRNEIQLLEMEHLLRCIEQSRDDETTEELTKRLRTFLKDTEPDAKSLIAQQKLEILSLQEQLAKERLQKKLDKESLNLLHDTEDKSLKLKTSLEQQAQSTKRLF